MQYVLIRSHNMLQLVKRLKNVTDASQGGFMSI